ncbi:MAG: hypothetical protein WCA97_12550 [Terriglobales bacterium]
MAKKSRSGLRKSRASEEVVPEVTPVAKNRDELQDARNRVRNVIVDGSVEMTRRAVRSVTERGDVVALRFLWEIAEMFPAAGDGGDEQGQVARSLIQKLGLYDDFPIHHEDEDEDKGEGDVKLES